MGVINITGLQEEAKKYQKDLRFLPFAILTVIFNELGIGLKQVANVDVITESQRKGGLVQPYAPGITIANQAEIIKLSERELRVHTAYVSLKDNIKGYQGARILNNPEAGTGINQTKEHPLKDLITGQMVRTVTEDIIDAMFHSERNMSDLSPLGCFDGYYTHIDNEIGAGTIAAAHGNLIATGPIVPPLTPTDTIALDKIVDFIMATDPKLRKAPSILHLTQNVYWAATSALENKFTYKSVTGLGDLQNYINQKVGSRTTIKVSDAFGSGDLIMLTVAGNLDFGMNTFGDYEFVAIRTPYEDPNDMQFWNQFEAGTRINSVHKKLFAINDGTHIANALSGDYQ